MIESEATMFHGLTFFGIPLEWFLRFAEVIVMLITLFLLVTYGAYLVEKARFRQTDDE